MPASLHTRNWTRSLHFCFKLVDIKAGQSVFKRFNGDLDHILESVSRLGRFTANVHFADFITDRIHLPTIELGSHFLERDGTIRRLWDWHYAKSRCALKKRTKQEGVTV
jgi:hypothetical protein